MVYVNNDSQILVDFLDTITENAEFMLRCLEGLAGKSRTSVLDRLGL